MTQYFLQSLLKSEQLPRRHEGNHDTSELVNPLLLNCFPGETVGLYSSPQFTLALEANRSSI